MAKSSTNKISKIKLELLRPGTAHNQLLSPLTPYIALCGEDGPVTINLPFEQQQLLMRLKRLRYENNNVDPAKDEQRQSEIRDIGEAIGNVLGEVPALLSELGCSACENSGLVHLNLVVSALELGMIPFEAAIAPNGFPGSGSPLFLQMRTPITITREIRRGRQLAVNWTRKPRILFAYAGPNGLYVPVQTHLQALREAIEPWVKIKDTPEERVAEVKKILTVLPNASIDKLRIACADGEYTHVHFLAHGDTYDIAGVQRYGIALCQEADPSQKDVVDGERLAMSLTVRDASGATRHRPTLVTLATCDSGNIESVLTPGGSIAHELNAAGIPWVIASQFPLWMKPSAIAAEVLYKGLLNGDDPRWVLYDLRQRLRTDSPGTHDWASIVAYCTTPTYFETQIKVFRDEQTRRKIDIKFDRIDFLVGLNDDNAGVSGLTITPAQEKELTDLRDSIRSDLKKWLNEPYVSTELKETLKFALNKEALKEEDFKDLESKDKAERLGVSAASEKRIGIAMQAAANLYEVGSEPANKYKAESIFAYRKARDFYREALENNPSNHWVITQYLSIMAILARDSADEKTVLAKELGWSWIAAKQIAEWHCNQSVGINRAWAYGTLAELTLLAPIYSSGKINVSDLKREINRCCKEIRTLVEPGSFPILSTRRQFRRYLTFWESPLWDDLAQTVVDSLQD